MRTLNRMKAGEHGIVAHLNGTGSIHQRLLEMGILEGTELEVIRFAPLGDPMEILVQGYHLLLRKSEAALVEVED